MTPARSASSDQVRVSSTSVSPMSKTTATIRSCVPVSGGIRPSLRLRRSQCRTSRPRRRRSSFDRALLALGVHYASDALLDPGEIAVVISSPSWGVSSVTAGVFLPRRRRVIYSLSPPSLCDRRAVQRSAHPSACSTAWAERASSSATSSRRRLVFSKKGR